MRKEERQNLRLDLDPFQGTFFIRPDVTDHKDREEHQDAREGQHQAGQRDPDMGTRLAQDLLGEQVTQAGRRGHFPAWSPDRSFLYFGQGALPDRRDLWRIRRLHQGPVVIHKS